MILIFPALVSRKTNSSLHKGNSWVICIYEPKEKMPWVLKGKSSTLSGWLFLPRRKYNYCRDKNRQARLSFILNLSIVVPLSGLKCRAWLCSDGLLSPFYVFSSPCQLLCWAIKVFLVSILPWEVTFSSIVWNPRIPFWLFLCFRMSLAGFLDAWKTDIMMKLSCLCFRLPYWM